MKRNAEISLPQTIKPPSQSINQPQFPPSYSWNSSKRLISSYPTSHPTGHSPTNYSPTSYSPIVMKNPTIPPPDPIKPHACEEFILLLPRIIRLQSLTSDILKLSECDSLRFYVKVGAFINGNMVKREFYCNVSSDDQINRRLFTSMEKFSLQFSHTLDSKDEVVEFMDVFGLSLMVFSQLSDLSNELRSKIDIETKYVISCIERLALLRYDDVREIREIKHELETYRKEIIVVNYTENYV